MATYYWVGGAGTWDATSTTRWSLTSGGAGGAGVPTSTDDVVFDVNSDAGASYNVSCVSGSVCRNLTASGLDRTLGLSVSLLKVYGNFSIPSTNIAVGGSTLEFTGTGSSTITTSNVLINCNITFSGGTWQLQDNFTSNTTAAYRTTLSGGTLNLNGKKLMCNDFYASGSTAKVIDHGNNGELSISNSFFANTATNLTAAGTGVINMSNDYDHRIFAGNGNQFATLNMGNTVGFGGSVTVYGNNTFQSIKTTRTAGNISTYFQNGTTTTFTQNFEYNGKGGGSVLIAPITTGLPVRFTKTFANNVIIENMNFYNVTVDSAGWYLRNGIADSDSANWNILGSPMIMGVFF